jgi:predicted RNase H-like HicB family nuclease
MAARRRTVESEIIFEVEEAPEGGYDARALGYSIYTQAETIDELKAMLQDAVRCHFEENERPRVIRLHLVKDEVIAV